MNKKLDTMLGITILFLGIFCAGYMAIDNYNEKSIDTEIQINNVEDIVYNPATGETWDSVGDYVYRNKTMEISG
jgi:hypothetical protein